MAADVERHQKSTVDQERLKRELELGRQIQNDMLPHAPLKLGLTEIKGVSVPAREVGGDFFNYFVLANGQIALLVGDVSGKGVGAALLMANVQASLRTRLPWGRTCRQWPRRSTATSKPTLRVRCTPRSSSAFSIRSTRVLRYVNAGHHPQYVLPQGRPRAHGGDRASRSGCSPGRGTPSVRPARAGDLLFFYTDGCVEAENERGDMFGADRLEPAAGRGRTADVLERIESPPSHFRGTSEPFDDATMMAVKVG